MDRRQQKTRKAVLAAFEELVSSKRYEQITVQDIIDLADIGRTTFYAHFETKDSVLDAICTDLFSHIFDEHQKEEEDHDFSKAMNTLQDKLTHILYHLKADQKHYRRLFSGESAELFWNYFRRWFELELGEEIRKTHKEKKNTIPEDLFTRLYIGIFIETVKWWFKDGCKKTPEQVERYFEEVF
jgi:AcrR family transcriptional regulator